MASVRSDPVEIWTRLTNSIFRADIPAFTLMRFTMYIRACLASDFLGVFQALGSGGRYWSESPGLRGPFLSNTYFAGVGLSVSAWGASIWRMPTGASIFCDKCDRISIRALLLAIKSPGRRSDKYLALPWFSGGPLALASGWCYYADPLVLG